MLCNVAGLLTRRNKKTWNVTLLGTERRGDSCCSYESAAGSARTAYTLFNFWPRQEMGESAGFWTTVMSDTQGRSHTNHAQF